MNVKGLIAELSKYDGELLVRIEGCDCINPSKCASFISEDPRLASFSFEGQAHVLIEAEING